MKRELMGTFANPCMVGSKVQFSKSSFGEVAVHTTHVSSLKHNYGIAMTVTYCETRKVTVQKLAL